MTSCPGKYVFAKVSLTIATAEPPVRSALAELAPFEQANAQRPEEIRADAVGGRTSAGDIRAAGGMKAPQQRIAAERNEIGHAGERHSRDLRDPFDQPLREQRARLARILTLVEAESRDHAVVEIETRDRCGRSGFGCARRAAWPRPGTATSPAGRRRAPAASTCAASRRRRSVARHQPRVPASP